MADENDAGASYLAALRQSAGSPAAAAPARAPKMPRSAETHPGAATAPARSNPGSTDKRKSPRYKCTGSARLQESGSSVSTWATFADISMHGCYVETASPHRAGAMLSMKLDANGFRVEALGQVRVVYPGLGMGISFAKMSDEDRERLRELVRSLSPTSVIVSPRAESHSRSTPQSDASPPVANPVAALQAMQTFFEDRHVMGREEFLRILRTSQ
jgi:hypothetical protein